MKYVWINPVTDSMYDKQHLHEYLVRNGYERVNVLENWAHIVKDKYKKCVAESEHTVIDMRCPRMMEILDDHQVCSKITIPDVYPILIHCALEISKRDELRGIEKVITTPCQCLADMGNKLGLEETYFVTWNQFMKVIGEYLPGKKQKNSPIPPGFFDETGISTISITGEEKIRNCLNEFEENEVELIEFLYCENGCHNGDGVRMWEYEENNI